MSRTILLNIGINVVFALIFVFLNNWAFQSGLDETFVALAIGYGAVVVLTNAVFLGIYLKK